MGSRLGSGLTWMLLGLLPKVSSLLSRVSEVGCRLEAIVGTFWLVARLLLLLRYFLVLYAMVGGYSLTFAVRASVDCCRWSCRVTQPVRCSLLWPAA